MSSLTTKYNIGGLEVHVYGLSTLRPKSPVTVLFLLHGRGGDHTSFGPLIGAFHLPSLNAQAERQLYPPPKVLIEKGCSVLSINGIMDIDWWTVKRSMTPFFDS
jgi:predicted esterase